MVSPAGGQHRRPQRAVAITQLDGNADPVNDGHIRFAVAVEVADCVRLPGYRVEAGPANGAWKVPSPLPSNTSTNPLDPAPKRTMSGLAIDIHIGNREGGEPEPV